MDRRELLDKAARDAEERMLLSRVWDKWEQCRLRNVPAATDFLSPQEQASAQRLLHMLGVQDGYVFFGGYGGRGSGCSSCRTGRRSRSRTP